MASADGRARIRVGQPWLGPVERQLVEEAMADGEIGHFGPRVRELEEVFSSYCGARHGVATSSGTAALHVALAALALGPGDEVIIPALTMIATANAVTYTGAQVVVADIDQVTWTLDPAQVEAMVTPRTRAVIPVHLYGHPCDMDAIGAVAAPRRIAVVEDAAEAHGAEYRGRRTGSLGDIAAFSFYLNKVVTTGEGGMVLTDDPALAERARRLRDQAFDAASRFRHEEIGFNYRMTNLQAAVGVGQMRRVGELVGGKRHNAHLYRELLAGVRGLTLPPEAPWAQSVFWMFAVVVEDDFGIDRDTLMRSLAERGVESRPFFVPIHHQPVYRGRLGRDQPSHPVSERLAERGLYLPSGSGLTEADLEVVVEAVVDAQAQIVRR